MNPKQERALITCLTLAGTVIGLSQFLIQWYDTSLNMAQKTVAFVAGIILIFILGVLNIIIWRK